MLLLIDAGNTRIKWALAGSAPGEGNALGKWVTYGMLSHEERMRLGEAVSVALDDLGNLGKGAGVERVLVSNVAGQQVGNDIEQMLQHALHSPSMPVEWFASSEERGGVRNTYRDPVKLGCDRFAAVIGAHALFPAMPLIVANCGTATTIDAVTADGVFLGGMILPGLMLMAKSLARDTAQLPQLSQLSQLDAAVMQSVTYPFANHTEAAMMNGCLAAQTGAIERAVTALARQCGMAQCVLSGGAAAAIAPHLSIPCNTVDNLVLIGLHKAAIQPC